MVNAAEDKLQELGLVNNHGATRDGGGAGEQGSSNLGTMQKAMMDFNLLMSKGEIKKGGHKQGTEQLKAVGQKLGQ